MAQVPKIDTPCPLGVDEQRRLDGHCARCDQHVHRLDAMSDSDRRALLAAADGPICVSYRSGSYRSSSYRSSSYRSESPRAMKRGAGFGIAIAATLVSGGAFAADPPALLPAATGEQASPVAPAPLLAAPAPSPDCEDEELELIVLGGVSDPRDAQWVDDSELPDLPMRDAATLDEVAASTDTPTANPIARR